MLMLMLTLNGNGDGDGDARIVQYSTVQYSTVTDITDMMEGDNNHDDDGNEQYGGYTY